MKFTLSRPPPRSKDLNALFLHHDPAARLPAIDYCGALAFSTMEGRLQYLFAPYVEYASDGTVSRILGNLSNDTTDLRPASLSHHALGWMPNVMKKSAIHASAPTGRSPLAWKHLQNTTWQPRSASKFDPSASSMYHLCFAPVVCIIPTGVDPPYGQVHETDVHDEFAKFGPAAAYWIRFMDTAVHNATDVDVVDRATPTTSEAHLPSSVAANVKVFADPLPPFLPLTQLTGATDSDAISLIKLSLGYVSPPTTSLPDASQGVPAASSPTASSGVIVGINGAPTLVVQSKSDTEYKETTANKFNRAKAMQMAAVIDAHGKVSNLQLPTPTNVYRKMLTMSTNDLKARDLGAAWRSMMEDDAADENQQMNLLVSLRSMNYYPPLFLKLSIASKYETEPCSEMNAGSGKVSTHDYLPQRVDSVAGATLKLHEEQLETQALIGEEKQHKSKKRTLLERLGDLESVTDVARTGANIISHLLVLWDCSGPVRPITYSMIVKFIRFLSDPEVKKWMDQHGRNMPQLPFVVFQALERFMCMVARIGENYHIVTHVENGTIDQIPLDKYQSAVTGMFDFFDDVRRVIRQNTHWTGVPGCTPLAFRPDFKRARIEARAPVAPNSKPPAPASRSTPPPAAPAASHRERTNREGSGPRHGRRGRRSADNSARPMLDPAARAELGKTRGCIFVKPGAKFEWPPGLSREYCADWMCVGRYCDKAYGDCTGHVMFSRMTFDDRKKTVAHAEATGLFWFNKATVRPNNVQPQFKHLLGTAEGPDGESA